MPREDQIIPLPKGIPSSEWEKATYEWSRFSHSDREAIVRFRDEICNDMGNTLLGDYDWFPLTLGFLLGARVETNNLKAVANFIRYRARYWQTRTACKTKDGG